MSWTEEVKSQRLPMEQLVQLVLLQLEQGGVAYLTVTGWSMRPFLRDQKDRVRLVPVEKLRSGDIILYHRDNGQYVLHRILRQLGQGGYLCCGDNQWETEVIEDRQILAVVTEIFRDGKEYSVRHLGYRFCVWLWTALHPIRRPILAVRRRLGRWKTARQRRKMQKNSL